MRPAAIFDLDGTLLTGMTAERGLVRLLIQHRHMSMQGVIGWLQEFFSALPQGWIRATKGNKGYLAGQQQQAVLTLACHYFKQHLLPGISARALSTIAWHKAQGHLTGILSGAPDFLVELFREHLALDFGYGTVLDIQNAHFTGKISGLHPYAEQKVAVLESLCQRYQIDLACSYGYANHYTDRFFLHRFGHPVVINPDSRLQRYARLQGWPVHYFD